MKQNRSNLLTWGMFGILFISVTVVFALCNKQIVSAEYGIWIIWIVLMLELWGLCFHMLMEIRISASQPDPLESEEEYAQLKSKNGLIKRFSITLCVMFLLLVLGIPLMNYGFLNQKQIDLMCRNLDERVLRLSEVMSIQAQLEQARSYADQEDAFVVYDNLIARYPENPDLYLYRGDAYRAGQHYNLALADYEKVLQYRDEHDVTIVEKIVDCYVKLRNYKQAIQICTEYIEAGENREILYESRGDAYLAQGLKADALKDYEQAAALNEFNIGINKKLGQIYLEQKDYDTAISHFQEILKIEADNFGILNQIGNAYLNKREYAKAVSFYSRSLRQSPNNRDALLMRGWGNYYLKDYLEAMEDVNWVLQLYPGEAEAYWCKGMIDLANHRWEDAITTANQIIDSDPGDSMGYYIRGCAYVQTHLRMAMEDINQAILLESQVSYYYTKRAEIQVDNKQYEKAKEDATQALSVDERDHEALIVLGKLYQYEYEFGQALEAYKKAVDLDPKNVDAWLGSAWSHFGLGEWDETFSAASYALELDPDLDEAYYLCGRISAKNNKHEEALEYYDKAIERNPGDDNYYRFRSLIYERKGEMELALLDLNQAIELNNQSPAAYDSRGALYQKLGNYESALSDYSKAIALDPYDSELYEHRAELLDQQGEVEAAKRDRLSAGAQKAMDSIYDEEE